jgi:hypothetical protein
MPGKVVLTDYVQAGDAGDYSAAFARAIHALCTEGLANCGGVVEVPAGAYPVTRTIDVPGGVTLRGIGGASVIVSNAPQCSGSAGPSVVVRLHRSGSEPHSGGLEGLTVSSDGLPHYLPCAPAPRARTETTQSYEAGKGAFSGCYASDAGGARHFDSTRMNAIGVLVAGDSGFLLRDFAACGLGTGIVFKDAHEGFADTIASDFNNTGLVVAGSSDWVFENLMVHENLNGIVFKASGETFPTNIHVMGGLVQSNHTQAIRVQACESCSFAGIHFENNGTAFESGGDIHLDGTAHTRHFSTRMASRSAWPSTLIENDAAKGCPVDDVAFDDDWGTAWAHNIEVKSDCPMHLRADARWSSLRRSAGTTPGRLTLFGTPAGLAMSETGQLGLGVSPGEAALTVGSAKPNQSLLDLVGEQLELRFIVDTSSPAMGAIRASAAGLELRSSSASGLFLSANGNVGVGTNTPAEALAVNGGLSVGEGQNLIADGLQLKERKRTGCDAAHRGQLLAVSGHPQICVQTNGAFGWRSIGASR